MADQLATEIIATIKNRVESESGESVSTIGEITTATELTSLECPVHSRRCVSRPAAHARRGCARRGCADWTLDERVAIRHPDRSERSGAMKHLEVPGDRAEAPERQIFCRGTRTEYAFPFTLAVDNKAELTCKICASKSI